MALIGAFPQLFFWVWVSNPRVLLDVTKQLFSQRAREKNQMSRLPRKNEALGIGNNGFPFLLLLFLGKESSAGSDRAPLKIRRPMMRLAAFRILIASLSRRFGVDERGETSLFGKGDNPFFSPSCPPLPIASFLHAKVQPAGTPRYCSLYNARFLPNVFYYLRVTSYILITCNRVILFRVLIAADSIEIYNLENVSVCQDV